jgi:hypothetical protein
LSINFKELADLSKNSGSSKSKAKRSLKKALAGVQDVIMKVKIEVIKQKGEMYKIDSIEVFEDLMSKEEHPFVCKLHK